MIVGLWDRCLVENRIVQQKRWVESRQGAV